MQNWAFNGQNYLNRAPKSKIFPKMSFERQKLPQIGLQKVKVPRTELQKVKIPFNQVPEGKFASKRTAKGKKFPKLIPKRKSRARKDENFLKLTFEGQNRSPKCEISLKPTFKSRKLPSKIKFFLRKRFAPHQNVPRCCSLFFPVRIEGVFHRKTSSVSLPCQSTRQLCCCCANVNLQQRAHCVLFCSRCPPLLCRHEAKGKKKNFLLLLLFPLLFAFSRIFFFTFRLVCAQFSLSNTHRIFCCDIPEQISVGHW